MRSTSSKLKGARTPSDWVNQTDQLVPPPGLNSPQFLPQAISLLYSIFWDPRLLSWSSAFLFLSPHFPIINFFSKCCLCGSWISIFEFMRQDLEPLTQGKFCLTGSFWHPKSWGKARLRARDRLCWIQRLASAHFNTSIFCTLYFYLYFYVVFIFPHFFSPPEWLLSRDLSLNFLIFFLFLLTDERWVSVTGLDFFFLWVQVVTWVYCV